MNEEKNYNISRKEASRLLKVSIRTVDRYIKSQKLSTVYVDGRMWLNKEEVMVFKRRHNGQVSTPKVDMSTDYMSIDTDVDSGVDSVEVLPIDESTLSTKGRKSGEGIYKKLYQEAKEEIVEKNDRLELANYRIGQLEAQVKSSIPLLEYHRESEEKKRLEKELERSNSEKESVLRRLSTQLRQESLSKRVFLIVLLTVLALQPLWLLLIYR